MLMKHEAIEALYVRTIELYSGLVDKLTAQINKPKSAWSKFIGAVEKVIFIAAGVAFGRLQ